MKNLNSVAIALCLVLGAGSVVAQDSGMAKDAMSHDQAHDGMKKTAMTNDSMKMDAMSKGNMAKSAMTKGSKSDGMMKKDKANKDAMENGSPQH